eukprot:TRINITY_DN9155_c0_g1_i3.p1 TRINITY_DN9155_c0_g1~~TRINITY_DN9155_c0_g1_i3.p1  ORF type:complete len:1195 (+),score=475.15 TRINITY_DN9155_c0_g1_i3:155-3739(+)
MASKSAKTNALGRFKLRKKKERSSLGMVEATVEPSSSSAKSSPQTSRSQPALNLNDDEYLGVRPDYFSENPDIQLYGKSTLDSSKQPPSGTIMATTDVKRSNVLLDATPTHTVSTRQQNWIDPADQQQQPPPPPPPDPTSPSKQPRVFQPTSVTTPAQRREKQAESNTFAGFQPPSRPSVAAAMTVASKPMPLKAAPAYPGRHGSAPALSTRDIDTAQEQALLQSVSVEEGDAQAQMAQKGSHRDRRRGTSTLMRTNRPVVMDEHRKLAAEEMKYLQQELLKARKDLIKVHKQLDIKERKVQASVLSIKAFWGPELEKERKAREAERQRAEAAEVLLRQQEARNDRYMQRIKQFQTTFERLQASLRADSMDKSSPLSPSSASLIDPNQATEAELKQAVQEHQAQTLVLQRQVARLEQQLALQQTEQGLSQLVTGADVAPSPAKEAHPAHSSASDNARATVLQVEVDALQAKLTDLTTEAATAKQRLDSALDQTAELTQARDGLREELTTQTTAAQARQAELTAAFEAELGTLRNDLATARTDLEATCAELAEVKVRNEALTDRTCTQEQVIAALTQDKEQLEARVATIQEATTWQQQVSALEQQVAQLQAEVDVHQTDRSAAEDQVRQLRQQLATATLEVAAASSDQAVLRTEHEATLDTLRNAQSEAAQREAQLVDLQAKLKTTQAEADAHVKQLEAERQRNAELAAQLAHERTRADQSEDEQGQRLRAVVGELAQVQTALKQQGEHLDQAKATGAELEVQLMEAKEELSQAKASAAEQRRADKKAKDKAQERVAALDKEIEDLRAQLDQAVQAQAAAERSAAVASEAKALRSQVKQAVKKQEATETEVNQLNGKVAQLTAAKASLEAQLKTKVEATRQAARSSQNQLEALQRRLTAAGKDKTILEGTVTRLKKELATAKATVSSTSEALAVSRGTIGQLEKHKAQLQQDLADAQDELGSMEDDMARATAAKARQAKTVQQLEARLQAKEQDLQAAASKLRELQEAIIFERTNALLSRVSDKDSRIATLEEAGAKRHAGEIKQLRHEREEDVRQLKEQFDARAALMNSDHNSTIELSRTEGSSLMDLREKLENREIEARRLRKYVDQLYGEILRQDDGIAAAIITGLPRLQQDDPYDTEQISAMDEAELKTCIRKRDEDNKQLEAYVDSLLQRIVDHKPSILEVMSFSGGAHS